MRIMPTMNNQQNRQNKQKFTAVRVSNEFPHNAFDIAIRYSDKLKALKVGESNLLLKFAQTIEEGSQTIQYFVLRKEGVPNKPYVGTFNYTGNDTLDVFKSHVEAQITKLAATIK